MMRWGLSNLRQQCLRQPTAHINTQHPNLRKEDKWDVAMIGADPARAEFIQFTAPYCQIEATYVF